MTTIAQLVEAVRALAAENPTFVYTGGNVDGCSYFPDEQNPQGCIVGAACSRIGVVIPWTQEGMPAYRVVPVVLEDPDARDDDNLWLRWLDLVQTQQDRGETWAGAIAYADIRYGIVGGK